MANGKYIVIEGIPGTGKSTVIERVARELQAAQIPVEAVTDMARPQDITTQAMRRIIDDSRYPVSTQAEVLLYNAVDSQALETIRKAVAGGVVYLTDSSYLSTLVSEYYGHGRITDYATAAHIIQYATNSLRPDLLILLDAPVSTLKERVTADKALAIDEPYLERLRAGYLWEAKQRNLPIVYATDTIDAVFASVWGHVRTVAGVPTNVAKESKVQSVSEVLAANPPTKSISAEPPVTEVPNESRPQVSDSAPQKKTEAAPQNVGHNTTTTTNGGKVDLQKYVTNVAGSVYSFTDAAPTTTIAAAMTRLSRHGGDMRALLLDGITNPVTVTVHDPCMQQLANQYVVIENASSLLTEKLEQGRLATYFEAAAPNFDEKDANGHYRYYIPPEIRGKVRSQYIRTMNQIFDTYAKLVTDITAHVRATSSTAPKERDAAWRSATKDQAYNGVRSLLPIAATTTVGLYAPSQTLEHTIVRLLSDALLEVRATGQQMLGEVRKTIPALFTYADKPNHGGATTAYRANTYASVKQLAAELLPPNHAAEAEPVTLSGYTPHNELDIVADILYEHSDLPLEAIRQEANSWPYQRKVDIVTAYVGERFNHHQRPGRALEKVHYSFDLISDYSAFRDLQRHRIVDDLEWQSLGPRLGYGIPKLVEEANATDAYEECFDLSLQLYSALQASGFPLEAQYATLRGHKLRWKVMYNAREAFHLHELHTDRQAHELIQQMHAKVAEVHPLLADAMRFVAAKEDPTLDRLAAERYTQYKLERLDTVRPGE
jgi:thymidylate kinase/thymidylate synthase ThyX